MPRRKKTEAFKVGRDAGSGRFIPVREAERRKKKQLSWKQSARRGDIAQSKTLSSAVIRRSFLKFQGGLCTLNPTNCIYYIYM